MRSRDKPREMTLTRDVIATRDVMATRDELRVTARYTILERSRTIIVGSLESNVFYITIFLIFGCYVCEI